MRLFKEIIVSLLYVFSIATAASTSSSSTSEPQVREVFNKIWPVSPRTNLYISRSLYVKDTRTLLSLRTCEDDDLTPSNTSDTATILNCRLSVDSFDLEAGREDERLSRSCNVTLKAAEGHSIALYRLYHGVMINGNVVLWYGETPNGAASLERSSEKLTYNVHVIDTKTCAYVTPEPIKFSNLDNWYHSFRVSVHENGFIVGARNATECSKDETGYCFFYFDNDGRKLLKSVPGLQDAPEYVVRFDEREITYQAVDDSGKRLYKPLRIRQNPGEHVHDKQFANNQLQLCTDSLGYVRDAKSLDYFDRAYIFRTNVSCYVANENNFKVVYSVEFVGKEEFDMPRYAYMKIVKFDEENENDSGRVLIESGDPKERYEYYDGFDYFLYEVKKQYFCWAVFHNAIAKYPPTSPDEGKVYASVNCLKI